MAAGTHAVGGRAAESNFRLERTGFAGRSPGALDRQTMDTEASLIFRSSRRKLVGMLVGSAVFVVAGIFIVGAQQRIGWLATVFFGLCVAVFAIQLPPNSTYLRVGPEGFTACTLFRAHSCRWSDVGVFKVGRVGTKEMVVFSFSQQYGGPRHLARLNVHLVGAEAAVVAAGTWDVPMGELTDVLNRYRERYGAV